MCINVSVYVLCMYVNVYYYVYEYMLSVYAMSVDLCVRVW